MTDHVCYWGKNTQLQCEEQTVEKRIAVWEEEKWTDSEDTGKVKSVRLAEGLAMELRESEI